MLIDTPAARSSDPTTSHEAAEHMNASGKRAAQQELTAKAVACYPGLTSLELSKRSGICRFVLARRLSECEEAHTVRRGDARRCSASNRNAHTWYPPQVPEQRSLLDEARAA